METGFYAEGSISCLQKFLWQTRPWQIGPPGTIRCLRKNLQQMRPHKCALGKAKLTSSKMKNGQEAVGSQAGTEALNCWLLHNLDSRSRWMAILHSEHALSGCDDRLMTPAMTWIGRMTRIVDPGRALAPLLAPGPELRNLGSLQYGAPNRFSTPLSRTCCGLSIIVMCKSLLKPVSSEYWGHYPSIT